MARVGDLRGAVFALLLAVMLAAAAPQVACSGPSRNIVSVKYRETPVDLANPRFEHKETSESSFVGGAWYDARERYMVIRLSETYYHYCRLPVSTWSQFKWAGSFGRFYNSAIKGRFDCRAGGIPEYRDE